MARKIVAPQRREQIVEALFQCLVDNGHEKISVKDIARRAGLHYGVIHYYFKSKDEIISALADYIISRYDGMLQERTRGAHSAWERIHMVIAVLVDESIFNREMNRVFYNLVQMAFERKAVSASLRKLLRVYRDILAGVIKEGIESGEFIRQDAGESASLMVALIEGMALQWVIEPKALDRKKVHKLAADTVRKHLMGNEAEIDCEGG
ncbi:TetR family transcriptional regulator C-terminal domain-containing protein [Candidatus Poribacteria bacterium]|nr:TetR family transcriptional regulator C-terminal domain-containing protein [Candidatus Poribacteria bacterium]